MAGLERWKGEAVQLLHWEVVLSKMWMENWCFIEETLSFQVESRHIQSCSVVISSSTTLQFNSILEESTWVSCLQWLQQLFALQGVLEEQLIVAGWLNTEQGLDSKQKHKNHHDSTYPILSWGAVNLLCQDGFSGLGVPRTVDGHGMGTEGRLESSPDLRSVRRWFSQKNRSINTKDLGWSGTLSDRIVGRIYLRIGRIVWVTSEWRFDPAQPNHRDSSRDWDYYICNGMRVHYPHIIDMSKYKK